MVYQHSKSTNRIISNGKRNAFNRDACWKFKTWGRRHINFCRLSLSNKYFISLNITHYQAFFPFIWIYFGLVYAAWGVSMIGYVFVKMFTSLFRWDSSNSVRV